MTPVESGSVQHSFTQDGEDPAAREIALAQMFGFVKRYRAAKIAQRDLIAAFENRGKNFLVLPLSVNEALVKEAMMTGIRSNDGAFCRMENVFLRK